jgi:CDP-diacylglycerol--glycerol-3-phosphate 3-phosphatidyltransferase
VGAGSRPIRRYHLRRPISEDRSLFTFYNVPILVGRRVMSLAHILSLSRVVAAPIIAGLILASPGDSFLFAAVIFCLASITDLLDGKLARYSQRASPLGVFLDTTADKVLVSLVLLALAVEMLCPAWIPIVIIGREFLISGLRSFAASNDRIISAHIWGKGKTALTMIGIVLLLLAANGRSGGLLSHVGSNVFWRHGVTVCVWILGASALLTIVSGIRYVVDAWPLFRAHPA